MSKENIWFAVVGLLIGVVVSGFAAWQAVNTNNTAIMRMMGMDMAKQGQNLVGDGGVMTMSMAEMTNQLKNKSGDEFDKNFMALMIVHHQGAIDMAKLMPARARHHELKTLGTAIITAQTKEITDMRQWQQSWGYGAGESTPMIHGGH